MDARVVCVSRGSNDVENAFKRLDDTQVQLLYTKFPVGMGTFRRNKFIYVIFVGPNCGVVKRGKGIAEINLFKNVLHGAAGISTTDRSSLSLPFLVQQMRSVFVTDAGNFSLEKIQEEYKRCIKEQQWTMHRDSIPPSRPHSISRALSRHSSDDEVYEMPSFTSFQIQNVPCDIDGNTRSVLEALHMELGPLNWATFEANPLRLTLAGAGNGGIFELVKQLPAAKWLFGLFRITLGATEERQSLLIFFQWIGSRLRVVRQGPTTHIFPKMASILAPYEYEVYLVGTQDLNTQKIINKCRLAFLDYRVQGKPEVTENTLRDLKKKLRPVNSTFTEEEYRVILEEERAKMDLNFDFIRPRKNHAVRSFSEINNDNGVGKSRVFDIKETLDLINQSEGGLVWGIFEARA
ncbi:hypothetical protein TcG_01068 [Trypanosoma cruzi]|uniref:ADF-H domain-containing protein n=2 Tax=Trypanosoma cruzi TaxID=5693 RepID=V5BMX2_TRYCR|nr:hypothetical protein TCDM_02179 [Trypanosoma cruzi Dm28c]KAF8286235.1 hypothetical protein TcBrA4_0028490 [Trypanosoma cruzi]PBJ78811.1 hypothetical protein BCY84_03877 [Trypanosoma cruzi cruzi]PBJ80867.1 hypothetical protein BCY84_01072 [Trypanosoma cruzi cruzi]PWU96649.1 hypothetical protein C4B63_18g283 [Trypanosoma cruzi]